MPRSERASHFDEFRDIELVRRLMKRLEQAAAREFFRIVGILRREVEILETEREHLRVCGRERTSRRDLASHQDVPVGRCEIRVIRQDQVRLSVFLSSLILSQTRE